MSKGSNGSGLVWPAVVERFERQAPAGVMARMALERALPASWVDEVFEAHRQRQYSRELLFSTVVELTTLVSLGLRPFLHAAARRMPRLPVSLASLYDKVNHTEPAILRALVRGSAERLAPLRGLRGAARPGHSLVVYDPDLGLAVDMVACEDAHPSERAAVAPLLDDAGPGELWIADRHFCTSAILGGWQQAGASFIVREHGRHPRLEKQGEWRARGRIATGQVSEQIVEIEGQPVPWRRIELALDVPTEDGETTIRLWSNLPDEVSAGRIGELYRTRWRIEHLFGRLESVLHSEITSLGHPRAALLGFAVAVLAYNVLALLGRCVEQAHAPQQQPNKPPLAVSTFHLALQIKGSYEGLMIAVPPEHWPSPQPANPVGLAERLLTLARRINPRQVATSKRKPKLTKPRGYVDGKTARAHVASARVLAQASKTP